MYTHRTYTRGDGGGELSDYIFIHDYNHDHYYYYLITITNSVESSQIKKNRADIPYHRTLFS